MLWKKNLKFSYVRKKCKNQVNRRVKDQELMENLVLRLTSVWPQYFGAETLVDFQFLVKRLVSEVFIFEPPQPLRPPWPVKLWLVAVMDAVNWLCDRKWHHSQGWSCGASLLDVGCCHGRCFVCAEVFYDLNST